LIKGFTEYISEKSNIIKIENKEEKIQDALFYREVDYILFIPKDYTKNFMNHNNPEIEIKKTQEGNAQYTQMMVNKYFKLADVYSRSGMNQKKIVDSIKLDLENQVNIVVENESKSEIMNRPNLYYNFANYSLLAISIYLIATVMSVFNNENIKKRNNICKIPYKKISNKLFLANIVFIIAIWLLYVIISFMLCGQGMFTVNGLLLILNSFIFTLTAGTIGFLISTLVKNKNAISGIVNVVALGLSFISGCFVQQQWLNSSVLNIAKFFPSYWYINSNEQIVKLTKYGFGDIENIIVNMCIVLGFGILYAIVIKIIDKIKGVKIHEKIK